MKLAKISKGMKTIGPSLVVIMLSRPSCQESVKSWTLFQEYLQHAGLQGPEKPALSGS